MELTFNLSVQQTILLLAVVGLIIRLIIWYANVNADRKLFKAFIKKVEKKLDAIFDRLNRFGHGELLGSQSPINLTDLGKEVSAEIEAKAIAKKMVLELRNQISGKSAYEIQELCFEWVTDDKLSEAHRKLVHEVAYKRGLTNLQTMEVIAIELREQLLTKEQKDSLP